MKEKYQLLLDKVIAHSQGRHTSITDDAFICNRISELGLEYSEFVELLEDFQSRRPSEIQYVDFYNHPLFDKGGESWWSPDNADTIKSNEQRILFLKQIISEL